MAKKYLKKIADALSGVDSEMPVIRSTPDQKPAKPSEGGPQIFRPDRGGVVTDPANDKYYANNPRFGVTTDMGSRMRDESRAFMESGKGAGSREKFVVKPQAGMSFPDAEKYPNPDMRHGSGFGDSYGSPSQLVPKNSKTPKQIADFIGQHAAGNHGAELNDFGAGLKIKKPDGMSPNKPIRDQHMHEIPESKPQGGNYMTKGDNYVMKPSGDNLNKAFDVGQYFKNAKMTSASKARKSKFTMSDDDINVIGFTGATGAGLGYGLNSAMDDSFKAGQQSQQKPQQNSQSDAHSYWTRKKNGQ